jgi:hypothetical protein
MKGQALTTNVISAIVIAMLLIVGVVVFANFESSIDTTGYNVNATDAITTLKANTYSGFDLASIIPIVLFAVLIIGAIVGAFVFSSRR